MPREVPVPEAVAGPEAAVAEAAAPIVEAPRKAARPLKAPKVARAEQEAEEPAGPRSSWSLFSLLDRMSRMDGLFREGLPVRYLPKPVVRDGAHPDLYR